MFATIAGVLLALGTFGILSLVVLSSLFVVAISISGNKRQFIYPQKVVDDFALSEDGQPPAPVLHDRDGSKSFSSQPEPLIEKQHPLTA